MTERLKELFDRIQELPEAEQERYADTFLAQLEAANGTNARPEWGPLWRDLTPAERAADFKKWMDSITDGPGLPDEALRRENIYD